MDIKKFKQLPIMGILRGIHRDIIEPLVETVIYSGLETIEITMNTPEAPRLIKRMIKKAGNRLTVGAGTVLTKNDMKAALNAGATFIVSPTLVREVVEACRKNAVPVFPGALTPQEIFTAWTEGATMVKVFPAKVFGPEYFGEIKGPFQDIELLACSGVTPKNIRSFFEYGASAVTFGSSVFRKEWLKEKDFSSIGERIKSFIAEFRARLPEEA